MRTKMLENGLMPEANTIEDFVSEGKALESAMKTMNHYDWSLSSASRNMDMPRIQSQHKSRLKKVGITFMKKSELDNPHYRMKPKIILSTGSLPNNNDKAGPKPRHHDHRHAKGRQDYVADKPRDTAYSKLQPDRHALDTNPAIICFNCNKPGHYAKDCKKPKWDKAHIRAAHTAISEEPDEGEVEPKPPDQGSQQLSRSQGDQSKEDKLMEIDVYDNDWYEWDSDTEKMCTMQDRDATKGQGEKAQFWKVQLQADKTAQSHLGNSTGTPAGTQSSTHTHTCTGSNPSTHGLVHDGYMRVHAGVNSRTGFAKYIIILSKLNYSN